MELPWDIRVKIYLTLYSIEVETQQEEGLSEREINILRWAALFQHIGCAKKSKTSKVYIYSFVSALFLIQMLESGQLFHELLEGSAYQEMHLLKNSTRTFPKFVDIDDPIVVVENRGNSIVQADISTKQSLVSGSKQRDLRLKIASELIQGSRQPLKPGTIAFTDRLFSEQDKPIISMPSHHNLHKLFTILNESSASVFHEMQIDHQESVQGNQAPQKLNQSLFNSSLVDSVIPAN